MTVHGGAFEATVGRVRLWAPGWRPSAWDAGAAAVALALAIAVWRTPIGSGDYGQWLMVSRFFSGDDVPDYRDLSAVAPFVPFLLAVFRFITDDPFLALNLLRVVLLIGLVLSFYVAAGTIFRSRPAGLIAAIASAIMTDRFLDLIAFGGLLQIASLIFMLLGLAAIAKALDRGRLERGWWTLASTALAFAVLSHAGSVVIVVPVLALAALVAMWPLQRRSFRRWAVVLAPALLVSAVSMTYWLGILAPANSSYGTNPASLAYRGPDRLFHDLFTHGPTFVLLAAGLAFAGNGLLREVTARRPRGYAIVAAWLLATWTVVGFTILTQAATDYPRFSAPIVAPLVVAFGGGASELAAFIRRRLRQRWPAWSRLDLCVPLAGVLLIALGPREIDAFERAASGYRLPDQDGLEAVSGWINANVERGEVVLVSESREAKWIEGLSGESTLFSHPIRYSFRPDTWERNVVADAIIRSRTALANGLLFAKFSNSAIGPGGEVPRDLVLSVNHDGEYLDVLRLPERGARVIAGDSAGGVLATLGALGAAEVERLEASGSVQVRTTWTGQRRGSPVTWVRTVTLEEGSPIIDIVDEVSSPAAIEALELEITRVAGLPLSAVAVAGNQAEIHFLEVGERRPVVTLEVVEGAIARDGDQFFLTTEGTRLHTRITAETTGGAISSLAMLYPPALVEDYNVRAVVLKRDPAVDERRKRIETAGFELVLEVDGYLLFARDTSSLAADPAPAHASGASGPMAALPLDAGRDP